MEEEENFSVKNQKKLRVKVSSNWKNRNFVNTSRSETPQTQQTILTPQTSKIGKNKHKKRKSVDVSKNRSQSVHSSTKMTDDNSNEVTLTFGNINELKNEKTNRLNMHVMPGLIEPPNADIRRIPFIHSNWYTTLGDRRPYIYSNLRFSNCNKFTHKPIKFMIDCGSMISLSDIKPPYPKNKKNMHTGYAKVKGLCNIPLSCSIHQVDVEYGKGDFYSILMYFSDKSPKRILGCDLLYSKTI